jgi:hypothetical protein
MKITPLDIVSAIAISSIVISAYAATRASKGQKAKRRKDTKPEKTESSSSAASTNKLRAELDDLKKRVAALEKK